MTSQRRDIDSGWAWPVLAASYVTLLVCTGLAFVAGMFQVVFLEEFQGSVAFTSWITALFSSQMQLAGPVSSLVSNHLSCRVAVMCGGALLTVGLALSSLADSLGTLFVTFGLVSGLGLGMAYSAAVIVVNYYFDQKRTMVNGLALSAGGLGIILTPQLSTLMLQHFTWQESLAITSAVAAHMCIFGALMFPLHERPALCCQSRNYAGEDQHFDLVQDVETPLMTMGLECEQTNPPSSKAVGLGDCEQNVCLGSCAKRDPHCSYENLDKTSPEKEEVHVKMFGSTNSGLHLKGVGKEINSHNSITNDIRACKNNRCSMTSIDGILLNSDRENSNSSKMKGKVMDLNLKHLRHLDREHNSVSRSHDHIPYPSPQKLSDKLRGSSMQELALKNSMASLGSHLNGKGSQTLTAVVVSRNPSLMSLVCSTRHLDLKLTPSGCRRSRTLTDGSIFDYELVVPTDHHHQRDNIHHKDTPSTKPPLDLDEASSKPNTSTSLLKNLPFLILCLQLFIANAACGIFNIHLPSFVFEQGVSSQEMTNVLSLNGFGVLAGRTMVGALANVTGQEFLLYWALHILGGIAMMLFPVLGNSFPSMAGLILVVSLTYGSVYSALTPITIRVVGLSQLATAFGLEMVCAGIGFFISPPIGGMIVDWTGNYDYEMYLGGGLLILSSLVLMIVPITDPAVTGTPPAEDQKDQTDPSRESHS